LLLLSKQYKIDQVDADRYRQEIHGTRNQLTQLIALPSLTGCYPNKSSMDSTYTVESTVLTYKWL